MRHAPLLRTFHRAFHWKGAAALALTLILSGCDRPGGEQEATATDTAPGTPLPTETQAEGPAEPREGELLVASPPQDWVETGAMQTPKLRMAEYGPGESEGRLERLTFEAQSGEPLPDPIAFVEAVSRDLEERCKGFQDINISSGFENGYPTSVRLMICPEFEDSPHGQVVMAKAIQGNEQFYVVTRRLQVPPMSGRGQPLAAQAMAEWTTHLKHVSVCDTRSDEHPCPETISTLPQ